LWQNKLASSAKIFTSATFGRCAVFQLQRVAELSYKAEKKVFKSKQKTQRNVAKFES